MDGLEDYYQVAGGLITVNSETAAACHRPRRLESWDRSPPSPPLRTEIKPKASPPGSRRGRWPVKGAFFRALRRPNRPGAGLPVRSGGHGPVPKLPGAGHRRPDHRRLFRPGLRRVGDPHRRGTPLPGHPRRHAGRGLRRVCHRLPPDQAGSALHPGGHRHQHGAVYRKPHGHGWKANQSLLKQDTIFTLFRATGIGGDWNPILLSGGITVLAGVLLVAFLGTRLGLSIRATGDNRDMVRSSSINPISPSPSACAWPTPSPACPAQ